MTTSGNTDGLLLPQEELAQQDCHRVGRAGASLSRSLSRPALSEQERQSSPEYGSQVELRVQNVRQGRSRVQGK